MNVRQISTDRKAPVKCPNQIKGETCDVCGSAYICLEPWRKKRTVQQRIKARREEERSSMNNERGHPAAAEGVEEKK